MSRHSSYQRRQRQSRNSSVNRLTFSAVLSYFFRYSQHGLRSMALQPSTGNSLAPTTRRHRPDYQIVMVVGVLLMLGLIVIYSVSPALSQRILGDYSENYFIYRQIANILVGIVGFIIASQIPIQLWKKLTPILIFASVLSLIAMHIPGLGIEQNGATRWVGFGPLSFQPAELIKLTTMFYLAFFLGEKSRSEINDPAKTLLPAGLLITGLAFLLVVIQRDMGTMMALAGIIIGLLFLAELPLRQMLGLVGVMGVGSVLSVVLFPHRIARFLTFLNPDSDLQGAGYHVHQALIAIGSGGVAGLGLGRSVQVYGYLPEAANDSIFAIWAEKFGFLGTLVILGLYAFLLYKLYVLTRDGTNQSARLITAGIMLWFAGHIVINTGAMLGLMPLTGITLPFLSYGGSSLLFMMIALGIAFQLSRYTEHKSSSKNTVATTRISHYRQGSRV